MKNTKWKSTGKRNGTNWHVHFDQFRIDIYNTPKVHSKDVADKIVKCVNSHDKLIEALKVAKEEIKEWHEWAEMNNLESTWESYEQSPEMKQINKALNHE